MMLRLGRLAHHDEYLPTLGSPSPQSRKGLVPTNAVLMLKPVEKSTNDARQGVTGPGGADRWQNAFPAACHQGELDDPRDLIGFACDRRGGVGRLYG
jgi:hypothetical protein